MIPEHPKVDAKPPVPQVKTAEKRLDDTKGKGKDKEEEKLDLKQMFTNHLLKNKFEWFFDGINKDGEIRFKADHTMQLNGK